jgi:hypothetical protein
MRNLSELIVDERKHCLERCRIAALDIREEARDSTPGGIVEISCVSHALVPELSE